MDLFPDPFFFGLSFLSFCCKFISPKRTSIYNQSVITTLTTSNWFAPIASTTRLNEGSILDDCPPHHRRFLNALIPHRSPSVIINVVVDLGLLLLVSGSWPHLLRLTLGPEPSFVSLLPLFSFPLRLLSRALYILSCCCSFTLLYLKGY